MGFLTWWSTSFDSGRLAQLICDIIKKQTLNVNVKWYHKSTIILTLYTVPPLQAKQHIQA